MDRKIRLWALALVVLLVVSLVTISFAAEVTVYNCQHGEKDKGGGETFYVKTGNGSTNRINFTMTKGEVYPCPDLNPETVTVYGSYEIKVYYKSGNNWVLETPANTDIYYKSSYTYSFKRKNTVYKVFVWTWNPETMIKSYIRKYIIPGPWQGFTASGSYWKKLPTCKVKNDTGCRLYSNCP